MPSGLVRGIVEAGRFEGASFVRLDWVREFVRRTFGFDPFPGTLNVRAGSPVRTSRLPGGWVLEHAGFCRSRWWPGWLEGGDGRRGPVAIVRPEVSDYPADLVEVVAPERLRGRPAFPEGGAVTVIFSDAPPLAARQDGLENR